VIFWAVTPCSDVGYQRFGWPCCLSLHFELPWRWKQKGPPKHWYSTTSLHSVTTWRPRGCTFSRIRPSGPFQIRIKSWNYTDSKTQNSTDIHQCHERDANPQSQCSKDLKKTLGPENSKFPSDIIGETFFVVPIRMPRHTDRKMKQKADNESWYRGSKRWARARHTMYLLLMADDVAAEYKYLYLMLLITVLYSSYSILQQSVYTDCIPNVFQMHSSQFYMPQSRYGHLLQIQAHSC